jgi:soluble lytic murein transglycosylase-like protein
MKSLSMFRRMVCSWLVGSAFLGVPLASVADVYKRIGQDGQVIFTDKPQGHGFALVTKANAPVQSARPNARIEKSSVPASIPVPPSSMVHRLATGQVILGNGPRIFSFRPSAQVSFRPLGADVRGADFANIIDRAAFVHGLDPWLLHAVIRAESAYNPGARSSKGAMGLMQLMPDTAARYGVRDPWNPEENVHAGARYLKDLMGMFGSDVRLAVAAYNAGEGNVQKYGNQIPPFEETRDYVSKVLGFYGR